MQQFIIWVSPINKKIPHTQFHIEAEDSAAAIRHFKDVFNEIYQIIGVSKYPEDKKQFFQNNKFH